MNKPTPTAETVLATLKLANNGRTYAFSLTIAERSIADELVAAGAVKAASIAFYNGEFTSAKAGYSVA